MMSPATAALPSDRKIVITRGSETALTMTITCPTRADRDALLSMRVDAGTARTLENLAGYLDTLKREA